MSFVEDDSSKEVSVCTCVPFRSTDAFSLQLDAGHFAVMNVDHHDSGKPDANKALVCYGVPSVL